MVLHSYSNHVPEVVAFNEGFDAIKKDRKNPYVVNSYMNIAMANSKEQSQGISQKTRAFIREFDPEIIVAVGEEAQHHVMRHYVGDPGIQIVFACIRDAHRYHYDQAPNVTGIMETLPLDAVKEVLKKTYKKDLKSGESVAITFLGDKSFRTYVERKHGMAQDWAPFVLKDFLQVESVDAWKKAVLALEGEKGVLILSQYHQLDKTPALLEWTLTHSPVPVIGLLEEQFYEGAPLCISSSAQESGEKAADYTQSFMHGVAAKDLPISKTKQFMVGIHELSVPQKLKIPKSFEVIAQTNQRYVSG